MAKHYGGVWIKNFSGSHIRIEITDDEGHVVAHEYHPGHDAKIDNVLISSSFFPPITKEFPVKLIADGQVVETETFTFHLVTVYQEAGAVIDNPLTGKPDLFQGTVPFPT